MIAVDLEQEYSAKAAVKRAARVREQRQRDQAARARSAEPVPAEELPASVDQLAAALGARVTRKGRQ